MTTEISTGPQGLLDAMLIYVRGHGRSDAVRVIGYRERSYNIGYCETCSEMVTDVRIYYTTADGSEAHYQVGYTGLGELIRDLTNDPGQVGTWNASATFEDDDERWDRYNVHDFDEEA